MLTGMGTNGAASRAGLCHRPAGSSSGCLATAGRSPRDAAGRRRGRIAELSGLGRGCPCWGHRDVSAAGGGR